MTRSSTRFERLRGFVSSWLFAPYSGSADLDLFKRLLWCDLDFDVVQVRRENADLRLLGVPMRARFQRTEIELPNGPRTPEARATFLDRALQTFNSLSQAPAFLLSHSNEVPSHEVALAIRERHSQIPWVAYFGDVVSRNPYVRHMSEYPLFDEDCATERNVLARADLIICNNEFQQALFENDFPAARSRLVTVPHCFVEGWYPAQEPPANRPFTFMHLGALYSVKRRAIPVLAAVDHLLAAYPHLAGSFRVVFVGDVEAGDLEHWRTMRHADHVEFKPSVPYLDSLALMKSADALMVIDGVFDEATDGLSVSPYLPGKLADAVGARRPILASTMSSGPTAELLRQRREPLANDDAERIAFVMKRHLEGRVKPDTRRARLMAHDVVGACMEACLRAAVVGKEGIKRLPKLLGRLRDEVEASVLS